MKFVHCLFISENSEILPSILKFEWKEKKLSYLARKLQTVFLKNGRIKVPQLKMTSFGMYISNGERWILPF